MYYILEHNDNNVPAYQLTSRRPKYQVSVPWYSGQPLPRPPSVPLQFELDADSGVLMPDYFDTDTPLFSRRLLAVFEQAGVNNLFSYPAQIYNPISAEQYDNYVAVNVVGLVSMSNGDGLEAPDIQAKQFLLDIDKLEIDEQAGHGQYCFRLRENLSCIVIHEDIVSRLLANKLVAVGFRKLGAGDE